MSQRRPFVAAAVLAALVGPPALLAQPSGGTNLPGDSVAGPSTVSYKGVRITPVGFFAAEAIFRQRTLQADMPSSFNAIPFNNTAAGQLSEFRASARQSRLGVLAEGRVPIARLSGYFEGDFLSSGISSNSNESNSYTFRVRQFWGQAAFDNGVTFSAGQMWSLTTPQRTGMSPRGEYIPSTIDAQYTVGYDWARQLGLRLTYRAAKGVWLGAAVEEPQTTFSARGTVNPTVAVLYGQAGGSALNATANYSYDAAPDVHAKLAVEPGVGHYELKAVGRIMRDRIYTVVPPTTTGGTATSGGAMNSTTLAGGIGASAYLPIQKVVDVGLNALYGRGIGRYGSSQLPDATLNAAGQVVPIRAVHGLATVDLHATPKLDVYAYGGVEFAYRTADVSSAGKGVGYGSALLNNTGCDAEALPGSATTPAAGPCNADTRALYQGVGGFWYRFSRGRHGTFQWGVQYSYTSRNTWSSNATASAATGGAVVQPKATDHMVFTSFRYYLP